MTYLLSDTAVVEDLTVNVVLAVSAVIGLMTFVWTTAVIHSNFKNRLTNLEEKWAGLDAKLERNAQLHRAERQEDRQFQRKLVRLVLHERQMRKQQSMMLEGICAKNNIPVQIPTSGAYDTQLDLETDIASEELPESQE